MNPKNIYFFVWGKKRFESMNGVNIHVPKAQKRPSVCRIIFSVSLNFMPNKLNMWMARIEQNKDSRMSHIFAILFKRKKKNENKKCESRK